MRGSVTWRAAKCKCKLDDVLSSQMKVESGAADFGLTSERVPDRPPPGLSIEPGYELETLLLTPKNHPLARQRTVRPADLRRYPLISSGYTLSDQPELAGMLDRSCVFDGPAPWVEPFLAATVRKYVELKLGVALVTARPRPSAKPTA